MFSAQKIQFKSQPQKPLGHEGFLTWNKILTEQLKVRDQQIYKIFGEGVEVLGLNANELPQLDQINKIIKAKTGFQGLFVDGLEDGNNFYHMLAERFFPIGNFIRDHRDINYTPAPDIVHDLYGHIPFLVNSRYADFCQKFGEMTCEFINEPEKFRQFERFFWFTIEFGLIQTPEGLRVFGAGIASSIGECVYALGREPEILPFDIDTIRNQEFKIDEMQKRLFVLQSEEQLYQSLPELYRRVKEGL